MAQPTIVQWGDGKTDRVHIDVATATVLEAGDLVYASSGLLYKVAAATNDSRFVGVAMESSSSTETASIAVLIKGVVDIDVASATYQVGSGLKYSAANKLTDDGGANTVAWVYEAGSAVTRIKVLLDAIALQKKFEVNA